MSARRCDLANALDKFKPLTPEHHIWRVPPKPREVSRVCLTPVLQRAVTFTLVVCRYIRCDQAKPNKGHDTRALQAHHWSGRQSNKANYASGRGASVPLGGPPGSPRRPDCQSPTPQSSTLPNRRVRFGSRVDPRLAVLCFAPAAPGGILAMHSKFTKIFWTLL